MPVARRQFQTSRRASGRIYTPWISEPGTWPLVLLSDRGVTTVDAAVADPNDVSTGNWSATNLSARTADTITDSNDGSSVVHKVAQVVTGLVASKPLVVSAEFKAGTLSQAAIYPSANTTWSAIANLATGALVSNTGCVGVVTDAGGGWYRLTVTVSTGTASTSIACCTAKTGNYFYQGDGTGTLQVRNVQVTQRNVSAWADQSGHGNHVVQATAANQPVLNGSDSGLAGQPSLNTNATGPLYLAKTTGLTIAQPYTVYAAAKSDVAGASYLWDSHTVRVYYYQYVDRAAIYAGTSLDNLWNSAGESLVLALGYDGANSFACRNSAPAAKTGNANTHGIDGIDVGGYYGETSWKGRIGAFLIHGQSDDLATRTRVMRWLGRKYGVAIT